MLKVKCSGCGLLKYEDEVCDTMDPDQCGVLEDNSPQELNFTKPSVSKAGDDTDMSPIIELSEDGSDEEYDD